MIQALYEATGGEAIVTSDVGQHQMWAAQYYDFPAPRRWINSGGLGTMGFGLPAAMGAAVGCPDQLVCCIAGDGSVQMNAQELATCAQNKIPIKVFIMNNGYLGMVRQWQELFWDGKYSHVDMGEFPDFVKLAEAYGATGMRFEDKTTLVEDMKRAIATDGPVLVDVRVTREENTYPMIPAGQRRARDGGVSAADGRTRNQGAAQPRGARGGDEPAHGPQARALDPRRKQVRRADAHRRPVRAARLQHRHAHGRPDRGRADLARDADRRRRAASDRPGDQAAAQARQRAEDPRPRAGRHGRARAGAVQGRRRRRRSAAS